MHVAAHAELGAPEGMRWCAWRGGARGSSATSEGMSCTRTNSSPSAGWSTVKYSRTYSASHAICVRRRSERREGWEVVEAAHSASHAHLAGHSRRRRRAGGLRRCLGKLRRPLRGEDLRKPQLEKQGCVQNHSDAAHTSTSSRKGAFSRDVSSTVSSATRRKTCAISRPMGKYRPWCPGRDSS